MVGGRPCRSTCWKTGGSGPTAGQGIGGGIDHTVGGTVWVDALTLIFANDASTSDDDVFGILTLL